MPASGPVNMSRQPGEGVYNAPVPDMPANVEAEAVVLSAIMLDNRIADVIAPILRSLDFYDPWHARIYDRILTLIAEGTVATPVTLHPYFKDEWIKFAPDEQGHPVPDERAATYIASLTGGYDQHGGGAAIIGARDCAEQVRELAKLRQLHEIYKQAAIDALDTSEETDPAVLISRVEDDVTPLAESASTIKSKPLSAAWDGYVDELNSMGQDGGVRPGISIAQYDDWNAVAGEAEPGDLVYLGGRPSMGKSGVGFAVGAGSAAAGHPTEIIGIEMNERQTTRRCIAQQIFEKDGRSPTYNELSRGPLTMEHYRALGRGRDFVASIPLSLYCPDEMYVEDLAPYLRRRKRAIEAASGGKQTLEVVVLDYLGRLGTRKEFRSPNDRVTYISQTLKSVAKKLGVVLIVLVQLSRSVEARDNKRPILADLRDSGSLEQDGDIVVFVYRDEYYLERAEPPKSEEKKWQKWREEMDAVTDRIEVYSAKKREGALTKRTGFFFTRYQALRSSTFYNSDLFRRDHQPGSFFEDGGMPEARG